MVDGLQSDRRAAIQAACQIAPEFVERAREGDSLRTMPPDLASKAKRMGLFRLCLPRSLGGMELDPTTAIEVIEIVSRADGSAGWTVLIGNSTAFFAWLDPAVAKEMIGGDPDFCSTGVFAPMGQASAGDSGEFMVSGRWPFNSGCPHSEWCQVGVFVMDGDRPRLRDEGVPDWRFAFLDRKSVVVEDTWDALGLRATGSHHIQVANQCVPVEHTAAPLFEAARHDGPLWRLPLFSLATILMAGFPLGVARRALDEFTELAKSKFRGSPTDTVASDGFAQAQLARAEAGVQAARSFVFDVVGEIWDVCRIGDAPDIDQRARLVLAANQAMRAGVEAVECLFRLAGASAVFSDDPLQRCFRDLHAGNQHIIFSTNRDKAFSKLRFGIDQPTYLI
ncbi:MAG TPA: acyl-CoA dehydrogenase family protein [Acidimicrobiales bacterium]|nr:acyl-CoA dehydrogenase family protein [Acidimicrobiales bacterium]